MTFGDIIEKILAFFGLIPAKQRKLTARIDAVRRRIAAKEDTRNAVMRATKTINDRIANLKQQLSIETNPCSQDLMMDSVDELEKERKRNMVLLQHLDYEITALRAIDAKYFQHPELLLNGADSTEIEMLMEKIDYAPRYDMCQMECMDKDSRDEETVCDERWAAMRGSLPPTEPAALAPVLCSLPAASPDRPVLLDSNQDVIASTFAPSQVKKNSNLLVSVFLHTRAEVEDIKRLAREIQKDVERRGYKPLACRLKDGDRVDVSLNIFGGNKLLSSQMKNITWQGVHDSCTFRYFITEDISSDEICCEVSLSLNNVPIGEMLFNVKIGEVDDATPVEFGSREYNQIFISYSHEDVAKVKYIANAYKLEGKNYFFDRHYLKSGDVYPEEIRNFINTSDLFILCWSANASKSEYVRKELSQALNLAYPKVQPREKARLAIRPISIDPRADPPDEMKDIYNFEEI